MNNEYPKWLYHASEPAVIVDDPGAQLALGPSWHESPAAAEAAAMPAAEPEPETKKGRKR